MSEVMGLLATDSRSPVKGLVMGLTVTLLLGQFKYRTNASSPESVIGTQSQRPGGNCVGAKKLFCGMTCYTTEQWDSVFCCEDKIWKRKSGEICCGNRLVNNKDFLCCENVRYSLKGLQRRDVKCCRKSLYHPSNTTCCPDTGLTAPYPDGGCCAGKPYDPRVTFCCGQEISDSSKRICCDNVAVEVGKTNQKPKCCGRKVYDESNQKCCNGAVQASTEGRTACCGRTSYDRTKHTCCKGILTFNVAHGSCCHDNAYDHHNATCCGNVLTEGVSSLKGDACCGKIGFNPNIQVCCTGKIFKRNGARDFKCCWDRPFRPTTEVCCSGNIHSVGRSIRQFAGCCRGRIFDSRKKTCCGAQLFTGVKRGCCPRADGTFDSFDREEQACCQGKLQPKRDTNRCCGTVAFNKHKAICPIPGLLVPIPEKTKLCRLKSYYPNDEICCNGRILNKTFGEKTRCCDDEVYNYIKDCCCNNRINRRPARRYKCCYRKAYDPTKYACDYSSYKLVPLCGGRTTYNPNKQKCCAEKTLYKENETCCDGKVFSTAGVTLGDGKCCGGRGYNPNTTICCGRTLHPLARYVCCGDTARRKDDQLTGCCQGAAYNVQTHRCTINGKLHSRLKSRKRRRLEINACKSNIAFCGVVMSKRNQFYVLGNVTVMRDNKPSRRPQISIPSELISRRSGTVSVGSSYFVAGDVGDANVMTAVNVLRARKPRLERKLTKILVKCGQR